jgi:hypothetical protein
MVGGRAETHSQPPAKWNGARNLRKILSVTNTSTTEGNVESVLSFFLFL